MRVPARVYDVEGGAIFAKNSTFVFFDGFAWTPRLRSPSPIMAPGSTYCVTNGEKKKKVISGGPLLSGIARKVQ